MSEAVRWEYLVLEVKEPMQKVEIGLLNRQGREGWEAYAVTRVAKTDGHRDGVGHLSFHMRRAVPRHGEGQGE